MSNYTLSSSPPSSPGHNTSNNYASTPRSTLTHAAKYPNENGPGMVVLPNGRSILVDNKAAFFAANPAARASTEKSFQDLMAWKARAEEKNERVEGRKREKRAARDAEMEAAGLHGCVGGKMPETCGECAGNGCAYGDAQEYEGKCDDCEGKGYILTDCEVCADIEKAKGKGSWNRGRKVQVKVQKCDENGDVEMRDA